MYIIIIIFVHNCMTVTISWIVYVKSQMHGNFIYNSEMPSLFRLTYFVMYFPTTVTHCWFFKKSVQSVMEMYRTRNQQHSDTHTHTTLAFLFQSCTGTMGKAWDQWSAASECPVFQMTSCGLSRCEDTVQHISARGFWLLGHR